MNGQQFNEYIAALLASTTIGVILPAFLLIAMIGMFVWVLKKAQQRDDFDASQFLRDDAGKLSWSRLGIFTALSIHSWVIAVETMSSRITPDQMVIYAVTWSASPALIKLADKWDGKLPWSK